MSDDLYAEPEVCQAILMDYYRNPRCSGVCDPVTHAAQAQNPSCGDVVKLSFQIDSSAADESANRILQARTTGAGCAVSQATASLLVEQLEGKTLSEGRQILEEMDHLLAGTRGRPDLLERLQALKMIIANPARVRCAHVAREAAAAALGVG